MYACICNSIKEKDLKRICKNMAVCDGESALNKAGCKAQCGQCLDYIENFVIAPSSGSANIPDTKIVAVAAVPC